MVMNHPPQFDFSSKFSVNYGASPVPNLLQQNYPVCPFSLNFNLPNSKFDHSPAFNGDLHFTFASEESGEDSSTSEGSPGLNPGSASTLEAPNGQEGRRKLGGTRGVRERGLNKSTNTTYKGVRKRKGDRWVSEIREPGKKSRIWLGTFSTAEMAASAYDVAAFNLKTPCAYLNFPEKVSSLPILSSRSPKHIQEAAASVAALRGVSSSSHMGRSGGIVATPTPTSTEQLPESTTMETKASSIIDEDMIFDMPNVLADMAEGLMITPPLHYLATATNAYDNAACDHVESFLWNL